MYDPNKMRNLREMRTLAPDAMAAFEAFNAAVFQPGALTVKVKELIAVAVAVTTQCPYCIEVHGAKARAAGATDAELAEATLVAAALRAGGSVTHAAHVVGSPAETSAT